MLLRRDHTPRASLASTRILWRHYSGIQQQKAKRRGSQRAVSSHVMRTYHVYNMASASRVLYVGVTSDLTHRGLEHKQRRAPGFTARYHTTELVDFEAFGDIRAAIAREKQIKGWLRVRKIALLEAFNPRSTT